jgi:hypothetical protein
MYARYCWGNLKARDRFEELGIRFNDNIKIGFNRMRRGRLD